MQQLRLFRAIRTATFGMLSFSMAQLAGYALLMVAFYALQGDLAALPFVPVSMACVLLALYALRELRSGLQAR